MLPMRRTTILPVAMWMAISPLGPEADADTWLPVAGPIRVSDAYAAEAPARGCTDIRILITNESGETVQLLGIETEIGKMARPEARVGKDKSAVLESIPIPPDEALSTLTSHLSIPVCDLVKTLDAEQSFRAVLVFSTGLLPTYVHIYENDE